MSTMVALPTDHPEMKAWERYKKTERYENSREWAIAQGHTDGSLWAAFDEGWNAAMQTPVDIAAKELEELRLSLKSSSPEDDLDKAFHTFLSLDAYQIPELCTRLSERGFHVSINVSAVYIPSGVPLQR